MTEDNPEEERKGRVYADGYLRIPARRWYQIADALSRRDELEEAILKVLGAINEKLAAAVPPPTPPPPPIAPPAPEEWAFLTDRLDIVSNDLKAYLSRIRGFPVAGVGRYAGAATAWQTLASWNVGKVWAKRHGTLREVSMTSNNFPSTRFRLRFELEEPVEEKVTMLDDIEIPAALNLPFPENRIPYDSWVYLDCRSTGPALVANGSLTGVEWSD